jgi:hypothetical protein
VFRSNDTQVVGEQLLMDFVEQPVTSGESTNENNMLEIRMQVQDKR